MNINKEKKNIFTLEENKLLLELWEKIKNKRKDLKISQAELSEKTSIDRSYISMVERWETNITYLKLKKLEKILNINLK